MCFVVRYYVSDEGYGPTAEYFGRNGIRDGTPAGTGTTNMYRSWNWDWDWDWN